MYIGMKWAANIEGPWNTYDAPGNGGNGNALRGAMDFEADSDRMGGREDWSPPYSHISSPDVMVDEENQIFVMVFHGKIARDFVDDFELDEGESTNFRHTEYVSFSKDGLNFNDPRTGGGQSGTWGAKQRPFGPLEVTGHVNGERQDISVKIGATLMRLVSIENELYGFASEGIISRPRNRSDPWAFEDEIPSFSDQLWEDQEYEYISAISAFFSSSEFANHPNNPLPGYTVATNIKRGPKVAHVETRYLGNFLVEVYVNIRKDTVEFGYPIDDPWRDLMRVILDCSDPDWDNWTLFKHPDTGVTILDIIVRPSEVYDAVQLANGGDVDGTVYADPLSMGVPGVIKLPDGRLYCFVTFNSADVNPDFAFSEGQIAELQLFDDDSTPPPNTSPPTALPTPSPGPTPILTMPPVTNTLSFIGLTGGDTIPAEQTFTVLINADLVQGIKWIALLVDGERLPKITAQEDDDTYEYTILLSAGDHRLRIRARDGGNNALKSDIITVTAE